MLMLKRQNYSIYFKTTSRVLARLSLDKYAQNILSDPDVYILREFPSLSEINLIQFDHHYFKTSNKTWRVPMCQHPRMYELALDDKKYSLNRINSIAFAGDFRTDLYSKKKVFEYFGHLNRSDMLNTIISQFKDVEILQTNNFSNVSEQKVIIADNAKVRFSPLDFRKFIAIFDFVLCFPGIHMPLCHNIIESMSLGTIPILHKSYAKLMSPELIHLENAFIFDDFDSFDSTFKKVFSLDDNTLTAMHKNVENYSKKYLDSDAVVTNFVKHAQQPVLLNAEWNSIT